MSYPAFHRGRMAALGGSSAAVDTDFVMVVRTTADGETFTLPCGDTGTYNANIKWGDGTPDSTITTYDDTDLEHTYAIAGDHTIRISGVLPWIYFNNVGDKDKVIDVLNGGSIGSRSCSAMFYGCTNLTSVDLSGLDTSLVTDTSGMFFSCSNLTTLNLSGLDTSLLTDMGAMFFFCSSLITLNLSGLDTSLVTDMGGMFYYCSSLITLNLSGLDTSLVTDMSIMFYGCSNITALDGHVLGNADNVSNTTSMFDSVTLLSQASLDDILAKMYANRANYTWATPVLDLSPPTAQPSGVYQDSAVPATGEEFRYKLENDPDAEGFNKWAITV